MLITVITRIFTLRYTEADYLVITLEDLKHITVCSQVYLLTKCNFLLAVGMDFYGEANEDFRRVGGIPRHFQGVQPFSGNCPPQEINCCTVPAALIRKR